jgi:intraflagellar transport protein 46
MFQCDVCHQEIGALTREGESQESSSEEDEDDSEEDGHATVLEGAYDPAEFDHLPVSAEVKELFGHITRYTPQSVDLEFRLKPFVPDFIPAVGDIDAFIKVPRPDEVEDGAGLIYLDEPSGKQSDPAVLDLQLRALTKQSSARLAVSIYYF